MIDSSLKLTLTAFVLVGVAGAESYRGRRTYLAPLFIVHTASLPHFFVHHLIPNFLPLLTFCISLLVPFSLRCRGKEDRFQSVPLPSAIASSSSVILRCAFSLSAGFLLKGAFITTVRVLPVEIFRHLSPIMLVSFCVFV